MSCNTPAPQTKLFHICCFEAGGKTKRKSKRPDPEITDKQSITSPLCSQLSQTRYENRNRASIFFFFFFYLYVMQFITVTNSKVRLQKSREVLDFSSGPPGHRMDEVERVWRMKTTSQWRTVLRATNYIGRTVNEGDNTDLRRW